jgi:hypothetical protein
MKKIFFLFFLLIFLESLNAQDKSPMKISGLFFLDYFENVSRDPDISNLKNTALTGMKDFHGFQFRRIYFTLDYNISELITARFRLEADGVELTPKSSKISPFIKDAYIKFKNVFNGSDVSVGIQPTLGYEVSETVWGYRSLEKTQLDLRNILSSRDMAVSIKGKFDNEGTFNYGLQYGNSSGLKPESDNSKRLSAIFHIKPLKNFHITVYGEQNYFATDTNRTNLSIFAGYSENEKFSIGSELFMTSQAKSFQKAGETELQSLKKFGFSVFGHYYFLSDFAVLVRYDMFDPNTDNNIKGDSRKYFVAGIDWKIDKKCSIIPNIQYETYEKIIAGNVDKSFDPSLNARITIVYNY